MRAGLAFTICLGACSFALPEGNEPAGVDAPDVQSAACPAEYNLSVGSHRLRLTDRPYAWQDAQAFCVAHGGHLVKIEDAALDDFIRDNILEGVVSFVWIGLYDPQRNLSYKWYDDTPLGAYRNFDPIASQGDCVDKDTTNTSGRWHAWDCSFAQPGVCECDG